MKRKICRGGGKSRRHGCDFQHPVKGLNGLGILVAKTIDDAGELRPARLPGLGLNRDGHDLAHGGRCRIRPACGGHYDGEENGKYGNGESGGQGHGVLTYLCVEKRGNYQGDKGIFWRKLTSLCLPACQSPLAHLYIFGPANTRPDSINSEMIAMRFTTGININAVIVQ
jgi:hypothetical protein